MTRYAMPYKTAPAISSKPYHDAVRAEKWLRTLSPEERNAFVVASDYMAQTERDAKSLAEYLLNFRYKVLSGPKAIRERFKKMAEEENDPRIFGWYVEDLHRMVDDADFPYLRQLLKYWKEEASRYLEDYYPGGKVDFSNPAIAVDTDGYLERSYDFTNSILPALELVPKLEAAMATIEHFYETEEASYKYTQQVRRRDHNEDKTFPEGVEQSEVMWHVTTAYRKIMQEGFKTKDELYKETGRPAGLGGGQSDRISFTASYDHAVGIHKAILEMVGLAKHPTTAENLLNRYRDLGLTEEGISKALDVYRGVQGKLPTGIMKFDLARNLYEYLQMFAAEEGIAYSAVFWSPDEEVYASLDPEDIQIIEATVDTTDPKTTYHRAEEEWRVPVKSILSYGPVGSQRAKTASTRTAKWERYDIADTAARLNARYFGGELNLDFPMNYSSMRRAFGKATAMYNSTHNQIKDIEITISNSFNMDREQFTGILAHELVHVLMFQRGLAKEHHGVRFMAEIRRLNSAGLKVPISEEVPKMELDPGKPFSAPVFVAVIDGTSMAVFRRIDDQATWERFISTLRYNRRKVLELFQTTNPAVRALPVAHSLKSTIGKRYKLLPDLYAALKPDLVSTVNIEK